MLSARALAKETRSDLLSQNAPGMRSTLAMVMETRSRRAAHTRMSAPEKPRVSYQAMARQPVTHRELARE